MAHRARELGGPNEDLGGRRDPILAFTQGWMMMLLLLLMMIEKQKNRVDPLALCFLTDMIPCRFRCFVASSSLPGFCSCTSSALALALRGRNRLLIAAQSLCSIRWATTWATAWICRCRARDWHGPTIAAITAWIWCSQVLHPGHQAGWAGALTLAIATAWWAQAPSLPSSLRRMAAMSSLTSSRREFKTHVTPALAPL